MKKFIVCTFAFLFWGFYEMSGGSDFEPGAVMEARAERAEADAAAPEADAAEEEQVARADTGGLLSQVVGSPAAADTVAPEDVEPAVEAPMPTEELTARVNEILLTKRDTETPAARALTSAKVIRTDDMKSEPTLDLRRVDGSVVNMRTGPGTKYSVVDQLSRGDEVEVLRSEGDWLKLRVSDTQKIGWMANYLVTASAE
ncbi:hypothetical protein OCH239_05665 [Roseivivax halodurans JCM 10272]|uniref:SH3b domain-containing protein n=1 Tax=Roseivivax halodurans JCM 10272 TaxID=1449350 RepID=X7EDL2_9RHOB|nr:SH3 domain-containing protein [Roseivivax halodurans]ETX14017.1 hypothetical protein OCH239_05665 [Roseivivax halodurans JCM 10272]